MDYELLGMLVGAPFGVLVGWASVTSLLAMMSGWSSLASRHPDSGGPATPLGGPEWGQLGWISYNGVLWLEGTTRGLRVKVWPPIFLGHSPIEVPWDKVKVEQEDVGWIIKRRELNLDGDVLRVSVRVAERVLDFQQTS